MPSESGSPPGTVSSPRTPVRVPEAWEQAAPATRSGLTEPGVVSLAWATTQPWPEHDGGWAALLSPSEQERARGIRHPPARAEFSTSRVLARLVLGVALDEDPRQVTLGQRCPRCGVGGHGKPFVVGSRLPQFSISHAGGTVLIALSVDGEVGVDVETEQDGRDLTRLAREVLTADQQQRLWQSPPSERERAFLRVWCAKEAVLKRAGIGLAIDPRTVGTADDTVIDLDLDARLPGAVAAVAVPSQTRRLQWVHPPAHPPHPRP